MVMTAFVVAVVVGDDSPSDDRDRPADPVAVGRVDQMANHA